MTRKSLFILILFLLISIPVSSLYVYSESGYAGAEKCKSCHEKQYDDWTKSGHAFILHKASATKVQNIPLPEGYKRSSVSYIIGGHRWKALFLDQKGYLITEYGKNQYDVKSGKWVDYSPGQKIIYDCGRCHTTGFSSEGHQDGLEGISGTWSFEGVQCEACHGPGAAHAASTRKSDIKIDGKVCSKCHEIESPNGIPLQGVFLAPYSETNQMLKNRMKSFACIDCHAPHLSAEKSVKQSCETCHQKIASQFRNSYMHRFGVKCLDCHMPPSGIVAEGKEATFQGDLRTHLFRIDHRKEFSVTAANGAKINPGYLSVDYACMRCHSVFETRQWAASFAMYAHRIKITTDIKIMRLQMVLASIGFLFAALALLSALSLKNWIFPKTNKKKMLSIHKYSALITLALFLFISTLCIYFHFPLDNPSKALSLGWFMIHIVNGLLGIVVYGGKILVVKKYKKGWASQGLLWGTILFVFWLLQYCTVVLSFFRLT